MSRLLRFDKKEIDLTNNVLEEAEGLVRGCYAFDTNEWKEIKYDLRTLEDLSSHEITDSAFAELAKYRGISPKASQGYRYNFFRICIQDHKILEAVNQRGDRIDLKALLLYIITHELIHIVRFNRLIKRFDSSLAERKAEEKNVHLDTYHILKDKDTQFPGMDYILDHYKGHRFIDSQ